ncbi:MAG: tRNA preQ1(34) S-adenosylmethionine ribosyltransferase-isomerase QueA [Bacteroidota bacterium]
MKLSKFDFKLPDSFVAKYPTEKRDESRLMVVNRAKKKITHHSFKNIPSFFKAGDTLVLNNTRVLAGQIDGYKEKTSANVIMILLRELDPENRLWDVCVEPSRKIRVGNKICIEDDLVVEVIDNTTSRCRTVKFCFQGSNQELHDILKEIGKPPLPAIIGRKLEPIDSQRYQTVYATELGSVVAPAAGFHFTKYILKYLELKGINIAEITIHLGLNTLSSLNTEDLIKCRIHTEPFCISKHTADQVNNSMKNEKKICAVGTSTLKALESSVSGSQNLRPQEKAWTSMFITPPYQTKIANSLLTNFHIPKSIDFINTLAFGGHELMMHAYEVAKKENYRFSFYGDACLII